MWMGLEDIKGRPAYKISETLSKHDEAVAASFRRNESKIRKQRGNILVTYRKVFPIMALAGLTVCSAFVFSDDAQILSSARLLANEATCNPLGECTMDVSHTAPSILQACESPKASVAWNRKRQGAFLVACDCECTSHDNIGWLIDMTSTNESRKVQKLYIGKGTTIESLEQEPASIPDIISSHQLCEKIDIEKLKISVFVTLIKQPTNDELTPYCFSPAYMVEGETYLEARTNNAGNKYGELLNVDGGDSVFEAEIIQYVKGLLR